MSLLTGGSCLREMHSCADLRLFPVQISYSAEKCTDLSTVLHSGLHKTNQQTPPPPPTAKMLHTVGAGSVNGAAFFFSGYKVPPNV